MSLLRLRALGPLSLSEGERSREAVLDMLVVG
jgi:hypothetical protein